MRKRDTESYEWIFTGCRDSLFLKVHTSEKEHQADSGRASANLVQHRLAGSAKSFPAANALPVQMMRDKDIKSRKFYEVQLPERKMVMYLVKITEDHMETRHYIFQPGKRDKGETVEITNPEKVLRPAQSPVIQPPGMENTEYYSGPKGNFERIGEDLYGERTSIDGGKRMGVVDQMGPVPYFGPYSTTEPESEDSLFWFANEYVDDITEMSLDKRLKLAPDLIKKQFDNLDPSFWEDLKKAYDDQLKSRKKEVVDEIIFEEEEIDDDHQIGKKSLRNESEIVSPRIRTRRGSKSEKEELKGEALGKLFVETHIPKEITGTDPEITPAGEAKLVDAKYPIIPQSKKNPGYVLNIPAHTSKDVDKLLQKYGSEATVNSDDGKGRIAAVVAVNDREPLVPNKKVENKLDAISRDQGFPYAVLGFYWAPDYAVTGVGTRPFRYVKEQYLQLDAEAQEYVRKNLFSKPEYTNQEHLPYGLFREMATVNKFTRSFVLMLSNKCSSVFIHIGDPDAVSWHSNNDKDEGVLTRYDQIVRDMGKDIAPMITGGYNLGTIDDNESPEHRLVKLGNTADRALRRAIASVVPEVLYATEPNLLVKAYDSNKEEEEQFAGLDAMMRPGMFGKKAAEGEALRKNLAKVLGLDHTSFDFAVYVDNTVETEIPDRILESASKVRKVGSEVLNIIDQTQSYLNTTFWPGIPREKKFGQIKSDIKKAIVAYIKLKVEDE